MRIAYVCCDPGVPVFGCKGSSIHVQEVLRELLKQGHSIDLLAACLGGPCPSDLAEIRVLPVEFEKHKEHGHREQAQFALNQTVLRLLNQYGPYQLVYERYSLFAYAGMEFARVHAIPGILEVNSPLVDEQSKYRVLINNELAERTTKRVMTAAGAVVAVSEVVCNYVRTQRLDSTSIHLIANGVNPDRFNLPTIQRSQLVSDAFTIGFVGTLKPWHGVGQLIDAFLPFLDHVPGSNLLIVGDGPELDRLKLQASELLGASHDKVNFLGAVEADRIPGILQNFDIAVAPYLAHDNFYFSPLKIFEYMAAALPIVASDIGQISELLDHGKSGRLVAPGDSQELAEALIKLASDPSLCRRLGERARKDVQEKFTWQSVVNRVLRIASEISGKLSSNVRSNNFQFSR